MPSKKSATAGPVSRNTPARGGDRSRIETALTALTRALAELDPPWMVIGGIAVIAHGVQRMTNDIDVVVRGDAVSVRSLIAALRRHKIAPRIANAETFAATNQVLLTRHKPTEVDFDLSFGWTSFEHEALAARTMIRFGETVTPMARVEDLLVFKAIAARPIDVQDAVTLLTLHRNVDMTRVRARVIELAEAAEAPELIRGLDQLHHAVDARSETATLSTRGTSPRPKRSKRANKAPGANKAREAKPRLAHRAATHGTRKSRQPRR
jgi:hypothetical protein